MPRRSRADAARTRQHIVEAALDIAARGGLESITVGTLAEQAGLSKAGTIGPFASRLGIQQAVIDQAVGMFTAAVIEPALEAAPGTARLHAAIDAWAAYLVSSLFPNGCFLTAAACELAGQPGPLRESVVTVLRRWRRFLETEFTRCIDEGTVRGDCTPAQLASLLHGVAMTANQEIQLLGVSHTADEVRDLMLTAITPHGPGVEGPTTRRHI